MDILLYRGDMRACLHALATRQMPIMSELLHVPDVGREPWTLDLGHLFATHDCVQGGYPLGHDHPSKTRLAPAAEHNTLHTAIRAGKFTAGQGHALMSPLQKTISLIEKSAARLGYG